MSPCWPYLGVVGPPCIADPRRPKCAQHPGHSGYGDDRTWLCSLPCAPKSVDLLPTVIRILRGTAMGCKAAVWQAIRRSKLCCESRCPASNASASQLAGANAKCLEGNMTSEL